MGTSVIVSTIKIKEKKRKDKSQTKTELLGSLRALLLVSYGNTCMASGSKSECHPHSAEQGWTPLPCAGSLPGGKTSLRDSLMEKFD